VVLSSYNSIVVQTAFASYNIFVMSDFDFLNPFSQAIETLLSNLNHTGMNGFSALIWRTIQGFIFVITELSLRHRIKHLVSEAIT
jgi:hypothetical protein